MEQVAIHDDNTFQLNLKMVDHKPYYILAHASIGQIMVSFQNILSVKSKNEYEEKLYAILIPEIKKLVNEYNEMLSFTNHNEMQVRYYNLITNFPKAVSIYEKEHSKVTMGNPKIGALIKAIKQRLDFIITREIPELYKLNENLLKKCIYLVIICPMFSIV